MNIDQPREDPGDALDRDEALAILVEGLAQLAADRPSGSAELGEVAEHARLVLAQLPARLSSSELAEAASRLELPSSYLASARRALGRRQAQLVAIWLGIGMAVALLVLGLMARAD